MAEQVGVCSMRGANAYRADYLTPEMFGAVRNGVTNDLNAFIAMLTAAITEGKKIHLHSGTYYIDGTINLYGLNGIIDGDGSDNTIILYNNANHCFEADTLADFHSWTFSNFQILGTGLGAGDGLKITNITNAPFNLTLLNMHFLDCGGFGINIPVEFLSSLDHVTLGGCGNNAILMQGGPGTILNNVYVSDTPAGIYAFRFYGSPTLKGCTGTVGEYVLEFGATIADDGFDQSAFPIFINCDWEGFTELCMHFKPGSMGYFYGVYWLSPAVGAVTVIEFDFELTRSPFFDGGCYIENGGGGWDNGYPIHTLSGCRLISFAPTISDIWYSTGGWAFSVPVVLGRNTEYDKQGLDISRAYLPKVDFIVGSDIHAFTADDATPSIANYNNFKTANVNATTITMFDNGTIGQKIFVIIADALTTIDFSGTNLKGHAGVDWACVVGDSLEAVYDGTNWYCTCNDAT